MRDVLREGEEMSELKPCPFCGEPPVVGLNGYPRCPIPGIGTHAGGMTVEEWQTRPLEDALQKRAEELEKLSNAHKKLACLMDQQQIDLRASISKAVELLEGELEFAKQFGTVNAPKRKEGYYDGRADAAWFALDILRRHGLIGGE